jgi:triphosphatase
MASRRRTRSVTRRAAGAIPAEIEAKLLVPSARELRALARLDRVGRYELRPRDVIELYSIYLDVPDHSLARNGVALRVRQHEKGWEATAKWGGTVAGLVHDRPELTVPLARAPKMPFTLPRGPLRTHLRALVDDRPLQPLLISEIRRQRIDVLPIAPRRRSQVVAEIALDHVRLRAPGRRRAVASYFELEIELVHGARREIAALARALQRRFQLMPSVESKFSRGIRLAYGREFGATHESGISARN